MKPRYVAISVLAIISLIGIINSVLGNIVATVLQDRLGISAGMVIIPFVVLAAVLMGYEMRGQLSQILGQGSSKSSPRQRQNRTRMIDKVEAIWIKGFLETSLYKITKTELQLENDPTFVEFPWGGVVQQANLPNRSISSSKDAYKVFKELGQQVLILGDPGSGKTTLLLELTKDLLGEARKNDDAPIPVVFHLSTWSVNRKSLNLWLVDELISKYDVPRRLAKEWIDDNTIMPLLDGLDEVQLDYRGQCIETINKYRQNVGFTTMVVCCRKTDYESLKEKLKLQGAIVITELSKKQIENYFRHESLKGIWQKVKEDAQLLKIVDTPLMLNIIALAFRNGNIEVPLPTETLEQRRNIIFDKYIEAMFDRRVKSTRFKREDTVKYLAWLAHTMLLNSQTIFYLEHLQPEWIESRNQQNILAFIDRLVWPVSIGIIVGLSTLFIASIVEAQQLMLSFARYRPNGDVFAFTFGFGRNYAILTGVVTTMCGVFFGGVNLSELTKYRRITSVISGMLIGGVVGFLWPISNVTTPAEFLPTANFSTSFVFTGILIGGIASVIAGGPSLKTRHVYPIERIRWSPRNALSFFMGSMLISSCIWISWYYIFGWSILNYLTGSILFDGLLVGFLIGAFVGLIGGIKADEIEAKTLPNQGINRSVTISLLAGIGLILCSTVVGSIIGGLIEVNPGQLFTQTKFYFVNSHFDGILETAKQAKGLLAGLIIGLSEIIPIAVAVILSYGGYAAFLHYSLRLLLWITKKTPFFYINFLDHCVDRIFLRRIGGGYIFVHRLLLENFTVKYHQE